MSTSQIDIRTAILRAAIQIRNNPDSFKFSSSSIPSQGGCGTPGCAIGWIGCFLGCKDILEAFEVVEGAPFAAGARFYDRMNELSGSAHWIEYPELCSQALCLYADKYHPASIHAEPSKDLKSGAEVCREIIRKPYKEEAHA